MSKFNTSRDQMFFQGINNELIDDVITTPIIIYKPSIEDSDPNDVFEESVNKVWKVGIRLNCLIDREDQSVDSNEFGSNNLQNIKFNINRSDIEETNLYPEIGDIIQWNDFYYEASHVYENQYIAGRAGINWAIVIDAHLTNISHLNIEEIHK